MEWDEMISNEMELNELWNEMECTSVKWNDRILRDKLRWFDMESNGVGLSGWCGMRSNGTGLNGLNGLEWNERILRVGMIWKEWDRMQWHEIEYNIESTVIELPGMKGLSEM